jgi:hypothetical protein
MIGAPPFRSVIDGVVANRGGAEVNAELERGCELVAGQPAQEEIQLPCRRKPRD